MNKALLSSKNMCWCTPQDFFDKLNSEFGFVLDPAATNKTAKCALFYTPEMDGLSQSWNRGGAVFCNPPYYATGTFLSDTNLANLPVLIHFNGDVLSLDGTMVTTASPIMLMLDFSEGKTHEIGLDFDGLTRVFVASASCS